jgi:hypothetical protein
MTSPTAGSVTDLAIRAPLPRELPRVLHLFRDTRLRNAAQLLVAERTRPLPRFVGGAAWWQEGTTARFDLACQPGQGAAEVLPGLIQGVMTAANQAGLETIQFAELLPDEGIWVAPLLAQSFERVRSERFFELTYREAWLRTMRLFERHRTRIPASWRTESIREHPPELILELAAPHRLLPPQDLREFWQAATAGGFDLDLSCIVFDHAQPFGTFLARRLADALYVDVQIVNHPNPRLRSLGDLCLLHHDARRIGPDGPLRWVRFRSGATEHRQTANLALRMGGRELPRRHLLARRVSS